MGENTKIEWADHTFNPWVGCTKVSPACTNCYAEGWAKRTGSPELWRGERRRTSAANWRKPLKWNREMPGARVFCSSLANVFEDRDNLIRWRHDLMDLIRQTPNLTWLLLTKRPDVMASWFRVEGAVPPNVQAGATVEDQQRADERIPHLLRVPATVRFLLMEPLLGPVDIARVAGDPPNSGFAVTDGWGRFDGEGLPRIQWVIAGGESGPRARPSHPDWFRSLRDQCTVAGVAFHFKQWGEWAPGEAVEDNGTDWLGMYEQDHRDGGAARHTWPDAPVRETHRRLGKGELNGEVGGDTYVLRVGKARAGRHLDGRVHDEVPEVTRG